MADQNEIQLFDGKQVRYVWDEEQEKYFFSVVDVIQVLTDSTTPRRYWSDLKRKLAAEGSEMYEKIVQLKLPSSDGKSYLTDVADTEQVFRLMVGHGNIALTALHHIAALAAGYEGGMSPAVDKEHGLFAPGKAVLHLPDEPGGEHGVVAAVKLGAHVHQLHPGQRPSLHPLPHFQQLQTVFRTHAGHGAHEA